MKFGYDEFTETCHNQEISTDRFCCDHMMLYDIFNITSCYLMDHDILKEYLSCICIKINQKFNKIY